VSEPLDSLFQRELTILSKNFGQLGRTSWELCRLLLRAREENGTMARNKGKSGAESKDAADPLPSSDSGPDEPLWLQETFDEVPSS